MGITKIERRQRIKAHIRHRLHGTSSRPRMCVYRSNRQMYVQFIDDENRITLGGVSSRNTGMQAFDNSNKTSQASNLGKLAADYAKSKGISKVVFDRNGYQYHGRVKALAESARENGLEF